MRVLIESCAMKAVVFATALSLIAGTAGAVQLHGKVTDAKGQPIYGAMIKVESASAGFAALKVFSDRGGLYRVPDLGAGVTANSVYLGAMRVGYEQELPATKSLTSLNPPVNVQDIEVNFTLRVATNISAQMPSSAWLNLAPDSAARRRTVVLCSQCHHTFADRVQKAAALLGDKPRAERVAFWRAKIQLMRTVGIYGALQAEHATPFPIEILANPKYSMFSQSDEDVVGEWLADNAPSDFDAYPTDKLASFSAPLGVNSKTEIREYSWPEGSFVRETAVVDGTVWVDDIERNRLGWLDQQTGAYHWHDVPVIGAPAPHTLVPDANGMLWVSFLGTDGQMAAQFDPGSFKWRIYGGFPKGIMAHDLSPGRDYKMAFDQNDYGWLTVISHNQVIGFHRDSGAVTPVYDLPLAHGETPGHISAYGGAMTSDGHFWYAQYFGNLGRFNTLTRQVDHEVDLPHGDGAHRLVVANDDILYVGLLGAGQVLKYDARNLKELGRIDLPDRSSALYAVMWDEGRNALWMGTANNDSLLRYNIADESFVEYPLAIPDLIIRIIAIDKDNGDLWIANSPIPATDPNARRVFRFRPGDS
ncbi:MAG: streptogramin lyase [Gammaproteobacteria bacterium]|jgi:streptogramin lyase